MSFCFRSKWQLAENWSLGNAEVTLWFQSSRWLPNTALDVIGKGEEKEGRMRSKRRREQGVLVKNRFHPWIIARAISKAVWGVFTSMDVFFGLFVVVFFGGVGIQSKKDLKQKETKSEKNYTIPTMSVCLAHIIWLQQQFFFSSFVNNCSE